MKLTLDIPADLVRRIRTTLAREEGFDDFVIEALHAHLGARPTTGWRSVFGRAAREEIDQVDAAVAEDLESVDPDEWR